MKEMCVSTVTALRAKKSPSKLAPGLVLVPLCWKGCVLAVGQSWLRAQLFVRMSLMVQWLQEYLHAFYATDR